jgi:hypothetical protein
VRPHILHGSDHYVFLGLDFSRARFADAYFRYSDLVTGKVPRWNEWVAGRALAALRPLEVAEDLARSDERNRTVPNTALVSLATPAPPPVLPDLMNEVAPYVDGSEDKGIIVFVECLSKSEGVAAHTVVFDRKSGAVILATQDVVEGDGFGVYDYYRNPLAAIARRAARAVKSQLD